MGDTGEETGLHLGRVLDSVGAIFQLGVKDEDAAIGFFELPVQAFEFAFATAEVIENGEKLVTLVCQRTGTALTGLGQRRCKLHV